MSTLALIAGGVVLLFDFQNLLSWWKGRTLQLTDETTQDYTIVIPLYGNPRYFTARESLEPLKSRLLIACEVSSTLMADYADELVADGYRVQRIIDSDVSSASLVMLAFHSVTTTYALRLDADTLIDERIANAVQALAKSGADLASVRVEAFHPTTVAGRIQGLEYRMSMLARHYRPWMTSGACFIGRSTSLERVFDRHSLWSPGEDIETGRVALAYGMQIRHVDYVAYTEVPHSWKGLFRQRQLWWAGNFRHMVMNFDRNILQLPMLTVYYILGTWVAIYFHVWTSLSIGNAIRYMPLVLLMYMLITVVCNLQVLSPWMLVFPVYSLVQTTLMPPLGALMYFRLARRRGDLGRYKFGWARGRPARGALPDAPLLGGPGAS